MIDYTPVLYIFTLSIILVLTFIFLIVPTIKILVMIDVFGWDKTRELLHDLEWYKGGKKQ